MDTSVDVSQSVLAGMSTVDMQSALSSAQRAYGELMSGNKVATASYSQVDGSKTVSYTQADRAALVAWIQLLQAGLGIVARPRRPARFNFR